MRVVFCWILPVLLTPAPLIKAQAPALPEAPPVRSVVSASAVAEALAAAGMPVTAGRVHLPGVVTARTKAPTLKLTGAQQRAGGALAVRVACQTAGECMPFFATVDPEGDHDVLAAFAARRFAPAPTAALRPGAAGITVGALVTLQLADTQMRIDLPAVAIDTGAPGAEVRVSSLDRKHTWRAVVVDAKTVRGGLQ